MLCILLRSYSGARRAPVQVRGKVHSTACVYLNTGACVYVNTAVFIKHKTCVYEHKNLCL